ncbi:putative Protein FAM21A [Danaus plexippus plexippus]|uniref:Uncharacterized protein n=1 Tax=Danaus plexippus plexippus TaxID=278856 RepID=A0A212F5T9_DANPL|nr:putative Protein FAM21A [Danaus plexippus plexippus]
MEGDTTRLRLSAPDWSLAGDSQLLDILQSLHQTIITKCQETNVQLESMMSSLDEASIHLQNVNNKFLGLSNSQFVESRVYDDHTEIAEDNNNKDPPQRAPLSPVSSLKLCLHTLESLHEAVPVMDSDSDEEGSARVVLRPLLRRGRVAHEAVSSDADSEESSQQERQLEAEYSDSSSEHEQQTDAHEHTIPPPPSVLVTSHTPPDTRTTEPVTSPESNVSPKVRKLYTVDKPVTAQIFPEEPPPLDKYDSDTDDDIFADLHTHAHTHTHTHTHTAPDTGDIVNDLFGGGGGGGRAGFDRDDVTEHTRVRHSHFVREESPGATSVEPVEPESEQTPPREYTTKENVKKPAGGISLFGGAGPEAIGAAVLRRARRQSSSDGEVADTRTDRTNVIDELFIKPTKNVKKPPVDVKKEPKVAKDIAESSAKDKKDKIDLFSDDIFDDIDDIFTSNVTNTTKDSKETLFNDDLFNDNNDLFNDNSKSVKIESSVTKDDKVRNIFDSDSEDDLFFDAKGKDKDSDTKDSTKVKDYNSNESLTVKNTKEESKVELKNQLSPNLFDDDDDDLFNVTPSRRVASEHGDRNAEETRDNQRQDKNEAEKMEGIKTSDTQGEDCLEEKHVGDPVTTERSDANMRVPEKNVVRNEFHDDFNDSGPIEEDSAKSTDREDNDEKSKGDNSLPKEKDFIKETKENKSEEEAIDVKDTNANDIFVDIFSDLPPAFEKPIEPKKSKNVNALFDDDSDDEALFFKKDDVITDEKPEMDFGSDRFRIFHDEPPDIDVDFTTKSASGPHTTDVADALEAAADVEAVTHGKADTASEKQIEKCKETGNENMPHETKNNNKINILKLLENEENNTDGGNEKKEDLFTGTEKDDANSASKTKTRDVKTEEESDSSERENRVIGKLKPTKLNINVNTLLPGAVPKKPVNYEETDGQVTSRSKEDSALVEEHKEKVVSFKEETNSEVLDNKLSKERARIQVKRRPSTRRARLEAVRKTGLDFGSDSTDNSSSFDEPVREIPRDSAPNKETTTKVTKQADNKDVISKVVYVLNDEDIFDIPPTETTAGKPRKEDLTETMNSTGIRHQETQGDESRKKKTEEKKTKTSLFDDSDEETDLFGKHTKRYIFDSDSDSELFGKDKGKIVKDTRTEEKDKERRIDKVQAKIPLFSDDSDEDLFGGKSKKIEVKNTSQARAVPGSSQVRAVPGSSQAFDDPLSVLGDERSHNVHI